MNPIAKISFAILIFIASECLVNLSIHATSVPEKNTHLASPKKSSPLPTLKFDHSHQDFTEILQKYVILQGASSRVNYKELKKNSTVLETYLKKLESVTPVQFKSWTTNQQYAFWVNAYNAYTIKLIIDKYPVKSIKELGGLFSSPWKKRFFSLLEQKRHLHEIEHKILRIQFNEPRTHFALNCASIGCPALLDEAYNPTKLESQLEQQTQTFLKDKSRNSINIKENNLILSKIFKWYQEDFTKNGGIQKFVAKYMTDDPLVKAKLHKGEFKIKYSYYDWKLNKLVDLKAQVSQNPEPKVGR